MIRTRGFLSSCFSLRRPAVQSTRLFSSTALHYEWILPEKDESNHDNDNKSNIVFLHGLLGSGRNLKTFAKKFCQRQQANGLLIDLPGHGQSNKGRRSDKRVTFDDCVQDLQQTLQALGIGRDNNSESLTLVGHSVGGRVALHYADSAKVQPQPTRLVLLDTVPGKPHAFVAHVVQVAEQILTQLSHDPPSRQELTRQLVQDHGIDQTTAQWLASMFDARQGNFTFDVQVAQDLLQEFDDENQECFVQRKERVLTTNPNLKRMDLVRGGLNESWNAESVIPHLERMETWNRQPMHGNAVFHMHLLPNANHWVHIDDLQGLLDVLDEP